MLQVVINENNLYYIHICKTSDCVPDVNECDVQSPCQHHCYNLIGSFLCQCDQGYELAQDAVSCQGGHTLKLTHAYICWQINVRKLPSYVHFFFFSVQTSMSAASPATCVSTSASTAQGATPASVQTDISSRETGCVKVLHFYPLLFTNFSFPYLFIPCVFALDRVPKRVLLSPSLPPLPLPLPLPLWR